MQNFHVRMSMMTTFYLSSSCPFDFTSGILLDEIQNIAYLTFPLRNTCNCIIREIQLLTFFTVNSIYYIIYTINMCITVVSGACPHLKIVNEHAQLIEYTKPANISQATDFCFVLQGQNMGLVQAPPLNVFPKFLYIVMISINDNKITKAQ